MHEASLHEGNCFITLTLSPVPGGDASRAQQKLCTKAKSARELTTIAQDALTGANVARVDNSRAEIRPRPEDGLSKKDHQKFLKRLRKKVGPVRFYMCGEYGEKNDRPHYHYIIFGYDFPDKTLWRKQGEFQYYRSKLLETCWPFGHSEIAAVTFETCAYVARYVTKKITGDAAIEHYKRTAPDGTDYWLMPEFGEMSRKPGLGRGWLDKYLEDVYTTDQVYRNDQGSRPPRYYDNRLQAIDPARYQQIKNTRQAKAKEGGEESRARLRTRQTVAEAKLNLKKRTI